MKAREQELERVLSESENSQEVSWLTALVGFCQCNSVSLAPWSSFFAFDMARGSRRRMLIVSFAYKSVVMMSVFLWVMLWDSYLPANLLPPLNNSAYQQEFCAKIKNSDAWIPYSVLWHICIVFGFLAQQLVVGSGAHVTLQISRTFVFDCVLNHLLLLVFSLAACYHFGRYFLELCLNTPNPTSTSWSLIFVGTLLLLLETPLLWIIYNPPKSSHNQDSSDDTDTHYHNNHRRSFV